MSMQLTGDSNFNQQQQSQTHTRSFLYGFGTGIMLQIASRLCIFAGVHRYRTLPLLYYLDPYNRQLDIWYENSNIYFYGSNCLTASIGATTGYITDKLFLTYATDFWKNVDPNTNLNSLQKGYMFSRNSIAIAIGASMLLQQYPTRCFNHMGFYEVGTLAQPIAKTTILSYENTHWWFFGVQVT